MRSMRTIAFATSLLSAAAFVAAAPRARSRAAQSPLPKTAKPSCGTFDDFLRRVAATPDSAAKSNVVDQFLACQKGQDTPLLEKGTKDGFARAIFLYRGNASLVALAGDMNAWTPTEAFTPITGTNLFYLSREFELDAALAYQIVVNDKTRILDPLNSRKMAENMRMNSYFTMPGYTLPAELQPTPSMRHGAIEDFSMASKELKVKLSTKVYVPNGYADTKERYRTLYIWDGLGYLNNGNINEIVDTMIQRNEIPPVLLVMLARPFNASQQADFVSAIAKELVPAFEEKYRTRQDAASRGILGGRYAIAACGQYPDVFSRCAAQSAVFYPPDLDFAQLFTAPKADQRFYIDVGTYETNPPKVEVLAQNRKLRDFLQARGYAVEYHEVHEGDNWGNWPSRVPAMLRDFWAIPAKKK